MSINFTALGQRFSSLNLVGVAQPKLVRRPKRLCEYVDRPAQFDWFPLDFYAPQWHDWSRRQKRARFSWVMQAIDGAIVLAALAILFALYVTDFHVRGRFDGVAMDEMGWRVVYGLAILAAWMFFLRNTEIYDDDDIYRDRATVFNRINRATAMTYLLPSFTGAVLQSQFMLDVSCVVLPLGLVGIYANHFWGARMLRRALLGASGPRVVVMTTRQGFMERTAKQWKAISTKSKIVGVAFVEDLGAGIVDLDGNVIENATLHDGSALRQLDVDSIVVMTPERAPEENLRKLSWSCAPLGVSVHIFPSLPEMNPSRMRASQVLDVPTLKIRPPGNIGANGLLKRTGGVIGSGLLIVLLSPIFIITALAVKLGDGGPIFYRAARVGRNGKTFYMWKFRSMCVDAEAKLAALLKEQGGEQLLFKMEDDPRITKVGKFIRRFSIDELPQLFNVFTGDMALVGPRPPLDREMKFYDQDAWCRMTVRPGMTGLWQVSGRSNLSAEEAIALDLFYTENWSPTLDLSILMRTFKAVIGKDGAY